MNVKELRERLAELPDDYPLFVTGYEGGVDDLTDIEPVKVKLNENTQWWYGKHEEAHGDDEFDVEGFTLK